MATISDVSITNWNTADAKPVASGLQRMICSQGVCGSKTLTVYQRTVLEGRRFDVQAGDDCHLVYVIEAPKAAPSALTGSRTQPRKVPACFSRQGNRHDLKRPGQNLSCFTW
jgi:hypothetical protein